MAHHSGDAALDLRPATQLVTRAGTQIEPASYVRPAAVEFSPGWLPVVHITNDPDAAISNRGRRWIVDLCRCSDGPVAEFQDRPSICASEIERNPLMPGRLLAQRELRPELPGN